MPIERPAQAESPQRVEKLIHGAGQMAELTRVFDWSETVLGPVEGWSESLLCSVNTMLACSFPSLIFWGTEMVQFYNDAFVPLLRERHPAGLGLKAKSFWAEAWHLVGPRLNRVMEQGETLYEEKAVVPIERDGRLQKVVWTYNYSPIFSSDEGVAGILVICQDVTNEASAIDEKERVAQQLRQVLAATTDSIVALDHNWVMTYLNPRAMEMLSAAGQDLRGKILWKAFPDALYEGSPFVEHYYRAMDEGVSSVFESFYPEPLNKWLHIEVHPTADGIVVFFRDITKERLFREELKSTGDEAERQRAEIESLYRTAPIGLALFDTKDFRYLRLNDRQADFFGLKPEQIVGRTLTEMAPIEGLKGLFDQVLEGRPVVNFPLEGELITDPEEHRHWDVSYFPVFAADGSVRAITAASLEVTQQKKTERALVQVEKLAVVGRLAASIAHEINNPLESVTNLLYLAARSDDLEETQSYIKTAESELQRVSAITNQTLRFHRQSTNPQEMQCDAFIDSVVILYQGRIVNSGIRVEERRRSKKTVRCFEGEIRQVVSNLMSNAIDAMNSSGGRLLLRSRDAMNWATGQRGVVLTIADTGTGMSDKVLSKIFDPFYTTKDLGGTGLGLWVSHEIISRHGGVLRVRSSDKKGWSGTVFALFLPFDGVKAKGSGSGSASDSAVSR